MVCALPFPTSVRQELYSKLLQPQNMVLPHPSSPSQRAVFSEGTGCHHFSSCCQFTWLLRISSCEYSWYVGTPFFYPAPTCGREAWPQPQSCWECWVSTCPCLGSQGIGPAAFIGYIRILLYYPLYFHVILKFFILKSLRTKTLKKKNFPKIKFKQSWVFMSNREMFLQIQ